MSRYWSRLFLVVCASLADCTSDPHAPVNQTFPIRQMDNFFDSLAASPSPAMEYPSAAGLPRSLCRLA